MVLPHEEEMSSGLVYDVRLSSVGPGRVTGSDVFHNPTGLDLAMKLHYLKVLYFFDSEVAEGLLTSTKKIKEWLFALLNYYFITCGRFRRSEESGRPYIKCNDCGSRFIEAKCTKTIDEWLQMKKDNNINWHSYNLLIPQQVIGPHLFYSPTVLLQVTEFKCGGISVGLSWAHVLGDPLSASDFINTWGQAMNTMSLQMPFNIPRSTAPTPREPTRPGKGPVSAKRVDPVGDYWILPNNKKMDTFSFHITSSQMNHLQQKIWGPSVDQEPPFESLCAIIWQCMGRVRGGSAPTTVTVCRTNNPLCKRNDIIGNNNQGIYKVEAGNECSIVDTDLRVLAKMLVEQGIDERVEIEEAVETNQGVNDFFVYGANLTFLDLLQDVNLYGLQLKGQKPRFVYYTLQGVGDEGVVLVMPWSNGDSVDGKFVTLVLPEDEMVKLKSELKMNDILFEGDF